MANLIALSACDGLLPVVAGSTTLSEAPAARLISIAPFRGKARAVESALKAVGLGWPSPGKSAATQTARIIWTGAGQAFALGIEPAPLAGLAALTDQTDGWARMRLEGADAAAVLARLVALDLAEAGFPPGSVARCGLNHMQLILVRERADRFELFVFRSMAASAVHELATAMKAVAARVSLG